MRYINLRFTYLLTYSERALHSEWLEVLTVDRTWLYPRRQYHGWTSSTVCVDEAIVSTNDGCADQSCTCRSADAKPMLSGYMSPCADRNHGVLHSSGSRLAGV